MNNEIIKKLLLSKTKPKELKDIKAKELVDLILVILDYIKQVNDSIKKGLIKGKDGYTPIPDKDYPTIKSAEQQLDFVIKKAIKNLEADAQKVMSKVKDGEVKKEHIQEASRLAYEMIQLPDFSTLLTQEPQSVRDGLELLQGEEKLRMSAVYKLEETIEELKKQIQESKGGNGTSPNIINQIIRDRIADGTIGGGGGITDGDKGDITVSGSGTTWSIDNGVVTESKLSTSVNNSLDLADTALQSVDIADINATGTPSASTYLRGDGTWSTVSGSGAVDSVNGQTGVVVLDADDIDDTSTTHKFVTSSDLTKLSNLSGTNTGDVTVSDSAEIDFTLTGQQISASIVAGSIDETKLDASVNASLDLADSALQSEADTLDSVTSRGNTTNNDITIDQATLNTIQARTSAGGAIKSNSGTAVAEFGAGGGGNWTFEDGVKLNAGTADRILATDTSKNIQYLNTTTYPSLTELSYVKGVTSAIQIQLGGKEATITAGTTGQYWRGDKTFQTLDKTAVGLSNVDNTSDATKNSATATLTNKTITDTTNNVTANGLRSATTTVSVSSATAPTSGQVLTATSSTAATWQDPSGGSAIIVRQYDLAGSPHTWTKPTGLAYLKVELWGAGGSGGCDSSTTDGGGGGGGAYTVATFQASELGGTETVTIGAGGASVTGTAQPGNAGQNSTFGSLLTGYAGGGGAGTNGGGGGGGGILGAGASTDATTGGIGGNILGGASNTSSNFGGGGGGNENNQGGSSVYGGGGGGGSDTGVGGSVSNGGNSFYGGGGGGGAKGTGSTGGTSVIGGNGGNGGDASPVATAGQVPGGGGGASGSSVTPSGAGGAGRCIVTEYY